MVDLTKDPTPAAPSPAPSARPDTARPDTARPGPPAPSPPPADQRPWGVWLALAAVTLFLVLQVAGLSEVMAFPERLPVVMLAYLVGFGVILPLIILIGLVRRHPLGRQGVTLGSALYIFFGIMTISQSAAVGLTIVAIAITLIAGLRTDHARRHFGLVCPQCGSRKATAASLLYNDVKCRDCKARWRWNAAEVDASVFD